MGPNRRELRVVHQLCKASVRRTPCQVQCCLAGCIESATLVHTTLKSKPASYQPTHGARKQFLRRNLWFITAANIVFITFALPVCE